MWKKRVNSDNFEWGKQCKVFGFEYFARVELNGRLDVTPKTRNCVLSVIEDLGSVRSRAQDRTGLLVPDIVCPFGVNGMQEVKCANAESELYPFVYTMEKVRRSGVARINPRSEMKGALSRQLVNHASRSRSQDAALYLCSANIVNSLLVNRQEVQTDH